MCYRPNSISMIVSIYAYCLSSCLLPCAASVCNILSLIMIRMPTLPMFAPIIRFALISQSNSHFKRPVDSSIFTRFAVTSFPLLVFSDHSSNYLSKSFPALFYISLNLKISSSQLFSSILPHSKYS